MTCIARFFDLFFGHVKTSRWNHHGQRLRLGRDAALRGDA